MPHDMGMATARLAKFPLEFRIVGTHGGTVRYFVYEPTGFH